jgi:hypothetical protein
MKRLRATGLLSVLITLAFSSAAQATIYSSGGNAASGGSTVSNGNPTGTSGNVNDFWDASRNANPVNSNYRLTFSASWLRALCGNGDFCKNAQPNPRVYETPSSPGDLGELKTSGHSIEQAVAGDVGWKNKCSVASEPKNSNACVHSLNGVTGNNSWAELHTVGPSYGGPAPTQGPIVNASIRIWRDCRHDGAAYTAEGSPGVNAYVEGSQCRVDPIYERVVPYTDGDSHYAPTPAEYFRVQRSGDKSVPGNGYTAYTGFTKDSAGPLYGSCTAAAGNSSLREWCGTGHLSDNFVDAGSSDYYEDRCQNGAIQKVTRWSTDEIIQQAIADDRTGALSSAASKQIIDWARNGREVKGKPQVWPPGIYPKEACERYSEWLTVGWTISQPGDGDGTDADVHVHFSGPPGRLYAVQMVFTDNRENIVQQSFAVMTSRASTGDAGSCTGKDGKRHPAGSTECSGHKQCSAPDGKEYADGDVRCSPMPSSTEVDPPGGVMTASFPSVQLVGQRGDGDVRVAPQRGSSTASMWMPRALKLSVYNSRDDSEGSASAQDAQHSYAENHTITMFAAGDPWGTNHLAPVIPDHPLGSEAKVYSSQVPLTWSPDNLYGNRATFRVANPTRALPGDQAFNVRARARAHESRFATLMGNARFPYTFTAGGQTNYEAMGLTASRCDWPNAPEVLVGKSYRGCGNYEIAPGWHVSDAYTVPQVSASQSVRMDLVTNFNQVQNGPAHLWLDSSNGALPYFLGSPEIWQLDEYMNRQAGDIPTFRGTDNGTRSSMNFCWPFRRATRVHMHEQPPIIKKVFMGKHWVGNEEIPQDPIPHTHTGWEGDPDCGASPNNFGDDTTDADPIAVAMQRTNPHDYFNVIDRTGNYAVELPAGFYVVVYPVYVQPGQTLPRTDWWGVLGKLQRYNGIRWAEKFDVQQQSKMAAVFRSRAVS